MGPGRSGAALGAALEAQHPRSCPMPGSVAAWKLHCAQWQEPCPVTAAVLGPVVETQQPGCHAGPGSGGVVNPEAV